MLRGRESLVRLVGKPRRFLPNRQALLSPAISRSSPNECKKEENGIGWNLKEESSCSSSRNGGGNGGSEWVKCPVCGDQVRGDDHTINSHLDACLARGKKRKLSQRTLFQLNFCSRAKVEVHSFDSDEMEMEIAQGGSCNGSFCHRIGSIHNCSGFQEHDSCQGKSSSSSMSSGKDVLVCSIHDGIDDDKDNSNIDPSSVVSQSDVPKHCCTTEFVDDGKISAMSLQTFIVGRRFGEKMDLSPGGGIILLRDPENIKDPNAVKVLSIESGCTLGFVPWELAQHLSPLIDRFQLSFQGQIISAPKDGRAVVPIQVICQNNISFSEKDCGDVQIFKYFWKQALHAVEFAKTHPPGMTKYQHNLLLLLQEVLRSNLHLFTSDEKTFLERFTPLSDDSQRLFARLYTRKGPWFRMSSILYPEISDCKEAINGLSESGYISCFSSMSELHDNEFKDVMNVLNLGELKEIMCMLNKPNGKGHKNCNNCTRKQDFVASLLFSYRDGLCPDLPTLVAMKTGGCIRITALAESLFWRAERLFFLNGEQDLSTFFLMDMGVTKYPVYNCVFSNPIFPNRSALLSYEEAIEIAQIMVESLDEKNSEFVLRCIEISDSRLSSCLKSAESPSSGATTTFLSCFSASWVYSKVLSLGVSFLESKRRYNDAIKILKCLLINFTSDQRRGYWTFRLSVDLEHIGHLNKSLQVAEDGVLDQWVRAGFQIALKRRVLRLGKPPRRWKTPCYSNSVKRKIAEVHVQGRPLNCKAGVKSIFYGEDGEQCGVEQLALQYYAGEGGGWLGVHAESGIWLTIFSLLMWDIIFADVPEVFHTKFQAAPLDLETDTFYEVRKNLIEALLAKIEDGMAEEILVASWDLHFGTVCRGVNWDRHSLSVLRAAVKCINGPCLASLCRHLAQDYRSWSSGMPDLLLWRFHDDYGGEAKLVEVKGPRDRFSEQQHAWLLFLMDCGFSVEVCKVSPISVEKI